MPSPASSFQFVLTHPAVLSSSLSSRGPAQLFLSIRLKLLSPVQRPCPALSHPASSSSAELELYHPETLSSSPPPSSSSSGQPTCSLRPSSPVQLFSVQQLHQVFSRLSPIQQSFRSCPFTSSTVIKFSAWCLPFSSLVQLSSVQQLHRVVSRLSLVQQHYPALSCQALSNPAASSNP